MFVRVFACFFCLSFLLDVFGRVWLFIGGLLWMMIMIFDQKCRTKTSQSRAFKLVFGGLLRAAFSGVGQI